MLVFIGLSLIIFAWIISSPILAIMLGIGFSLVLQPPSNNIFKKSGTKLIQTGIIFLGLSINLFDAIEITETYFFTISIFVIVIFLLVLFVGKVFKIDKKFTFLVAAGSSICGGTAMTAISPLMKNQPSDLAMAISIIFVLNAIGIVLFPILGHWLNLSEMEFGALAATALHDTSAVIGASLAYGSTALETATTLKLARTLWIIPMVIFVSLWFKNNQRKFQVPVFIILFILAIFIGSNVALPIPAESVAIVSKYFLISGLFCIGSQITKESLRLMDFKKVIFTTFLWILIIPIAFLMVV